MATLMLPILTSTALLSLKLAAMSCISIAPARSPTEYVRRGSDAVCAQCTSFCTKASYNNSKTAIKILAESFFDVDRITVIISSMKLILLNICWRQEDATAVDVGFDTSHLSLFLQILTVSWKTADVSSPGMASNRMRQDTVCSSGWSRLLSMYEDTNCNKESQVQIASTVAAYRTHRNNY